LLKRGNKNVDIKFNAHERFWNNIHQVAQDQKIGKPNNIFDNKSNVLQDSFLYVGVKYQQSLIALITCFLSEGQS
jgi:hypothetical protein